MSAKTFRRGEDAPHPFRDPLEDLFSDDTHVLGRVSALVHVVLDAVARVVDAEKVLCER
jgi:hypothetical protein